MALGGETVTNTVEGWERYTVNIRYPRDFRDNPEAIARDVLVSLPGSGAVPLGEIAKVQQTRGPNTIRDADLDWSKLHAQLLAASTSKPRRAGEIYRLRTLALRLGARRHGQENTSAVNANVPSEKRPGCQSLSVVLSGGLRSMTTG